MIAVDTIQSHGALLQPVSTFSPLFKSPQSQATPRDTINRLPPRKASLPVPRHNAPLSATTKSPLSTPRPAHAQSLGIPKDIQIDYWVTKIFSIINNGPAGGFVSYAISPRNELYVDRTGNRADVEDVVKDLLPKDSCRYIAYKIRYQRNDIEKMRMVWFMWTPGEAAKESSMYIQGLAGSLIGVNSPSSIPIIEGKSISDLSQSKVMAQV